MLKRLKNKKGQGLVEYLIIVAIMAVGTMAIMRIMNQTVAVKFARVTKTLQGGESKVNFNQPTIEEEHFKKRDMSNFFHGASSKNSGGREDD